MHKLTNDRRVWGTTALAAGMLMGGSVLLGVGPAYWVARYRGEDADLRRTMLVLAPLAHAGLSGANLTGANLQGANLFQASLDGINLADADLHGADLAGAYLSGAQRSSWFFCVTYGFGNLICYGVSDFYFWRPALRGIHWPPRRTDPLARSPRPSPAQHHPVLVGE